MNAALAANNLQATISTAGAITITTSNDAASATIGAIGGTATAASQAFNGLTASAPVQDAAAQLTRANLVTQYNNIIQQIGNIAQDASYAGVNLLGGDTLKLVFNETGKSTLSITGVTFDPAGLGLTSLAAGTDFVDNNATACRGFAPQWPSSVWKITPLICSLVMPRKRSAAPRSETSSPEILTLATASTVTATPSFV